MNGYQIQEFINDLFGTVRGFNDEFGNLWFMGSDIAKCLGYSRPNDAIHDHVDDEDKRFIDNKNSQFLIRQFDVFQNSQFGGFEIPNRGIVIINESGLYSLILRSKLPVTKQFKHWVTSVVLPSMRKIGFQESENLLREELNKRIQENNILRSVNNDLQNAINNKQDGLGDMHLSKIKLDLELKCILYNLISNPKISEEDTIYVIANDPTYIGIDNINNSINNFMNKYNLE